MIELRFIARLGIVLFLTLGSDAAGPGALDKSGYYVTADKV